MFNQLFREPAAIRRYLNAPLLEDRLLYLNHCAKQGNAPTILCQIAKYQLGIIEHVPLETGSAHTLEDIKIAANRYMASYKPQTSCSEISLLTYKKEFIRYANHWLRFLGRLRVHECPIASQIMAFTDYMQNEKGLSKASVIQRRHHLKIFFSQTREEPGQFLAHLTPKQVDGALIQISQKGIYTHWSMQCIASSLRTFFKYLAHAPQRDHSSVLIRGKGNKFRRCPLWPQTVNEITLLVKDRLPTEHVFLNRCGQPITRFGIHTLVKRHAQKVSKLMPSLKTKRVSPHTIRHTTATHMLRAGVDINTIRAYLGHVSMNTTTIYAETDLEMKAKALALCEVKKSRMTGHWRDDVGLMNFLRSI